MAFRQVSNLYERIDSLGNDGPTRADSFSASRWPAQYTRSVLAVESTAALLE